MRGHRKEKLRENSSEKKREGSFTGIVYRDRLERERERKKGARE